MADQLQSSPQQADTAGAELSVTIEGAAGLPKELLRKMEQAVRNAVVDQLASAGSQPAFRVADLGPAPPTAAAATAADTEHYGIFVVVHF